MAPCNGTAASIGFRNVIVRHPEKHLTVIVLTNQATPNPIRWR